MINHPVPEQCTFEVAKLLQAIDLSKTLVVGIGQDSGLKKLQSDVAVLRPSTKILDVVISKNASKKEHLQQIDHAVNLICAQSQHVIALLVDKTIDEINYLHRISKKIKELDIVVASCYGRPLFYASPPEFAGVITYATMFSLASKFVASEQRGGDYLEFGTFDGRTMSLAWHTMARRNPLMRFIGFDSFSGIIGSLEQESPGYDDGNYYSNEITFWHNMRSAGVDITRTIAVKGDFAKTLDPPSELHRTLNIQRCLVANIDCDIYRAAKLALHFLTDILVQGAVLMFDEFHANRANNNLGERRALREWLKENPHISVEQWYDYALVGRSFIVHIDHEY